MSPKKALIGVLAGMAAGAALGILFAPDKGSRTRRNIVRKGEDLAGKLSDQIDDKFDELLDEIRGKARREKNQTEKTSDQSATV